MINALQIMVHYPLLSVDFPINALTFFNLVIEISYFDFIPSENYLNLLFNFTKNESYNEQFESLDIF